MCRVRMSVVAFGQRTKGKRAPPSSPHEKNSATFSEVLLPHYPDLTTTLHASSFFENVPPCGAVYNHGRGHQHARTCASTVKLNRSRQFLELSFAVRACKTQKTRTDFLVSASHCIEHIVETPKVSYEWRVRPESECTQQDKQQSCPIIFFAEPEVTYLQRRAASAHGRQ